MRYFNYISWDEEDEIFYKPPLPFSNFSSQETLSYAIGAALYTPATRPTIAEDILNGKHEGLVSMVLDLEDAIGDHQVELAETSLVEQLHRLASYVELGILPKADVPLLFIRVRSPEQVRRIVELLEEQIVWITGFFFPKFTPENGAQYFQALHEYNLYKAPNTPTLYGAPILESAQVIYRELRMETLFGIQKILEQFKDLVLNVRIGATDFSSLFGVRRSSSHTIYDIATIRDCLADILNVFGRVEAGYVISGPVWEYFTSQEQHGLIREVLLDKENGIVGKTIIHPSHIKIVQSLYTVTHEEYLDATSIVESHNGYQGVIKSGYGNKMNEIKPHLNWAKRILARANVYGVLHEQQNLDILRTQRGQAYV